MVTVTIRHKRYVVEAAITSEEQKKGLSLRDGLDTCQGMLFVLTRPEIAAVWMKDVKFPLDILWIDSNRRIVHMASLLEGWPSDFQEEIPPVEANFVLEIRAGEIASWGFSIGDEVGIR